MQKVTRVFQLVIAAALATNLHAAASWSSIDSYVEARMRQQRVPGLALVIVENGVITHSRGFGVADGAGRPMTATTPLLIGSLSKAFTATAVLQLVDEKRIELDRPVKAYLPYFRTANEAVSARITVRHLLNQTGGIPTDAPRATGPAASLSDHVKALASVQLVSAPGAKHVYSSPNYQILGAIVEQVSGLSFGDFIRERIFVPLKMTQSYVSEAEALRAGLAEGHSLWFGVARPSRTVFEVDRLPTASIASSAEDLARFAAMHLGAEVSAPVLSKAMLAEGHKGVREANGFAYAMGWREGKTAGVPSLWHGGALPNFRGAVVLLPQRNTGVIVLTNSSTMFADHTREIARSIVAMLSGQALPEQQRSLGMTSLFVAVAALTLLLLQLNGLRKALTGAGPFRLPPTIIFDLLFPLVLLYMIRRTTGVPWAHLYRSSPDIAVVTWTLVALSIITGIVKLSKMRRGAGGRGPE